MKTHRLKIDSKYFDAVRYEVKTFEIRKNDRDFQVGDTLLLSEYKDGKSTGNMVNVVITYITDFEQKDDYVVMAIVPEDSEHRIRRWSEADI